MVRVSLLSLRTLATLKLQRYHTALRAQNETPQRRKRLADHVPVVHCDDHISNPVTARTHNRVGAMPCSLSARQDRIFTEQTPRVLQSLR